MTGPTRFSTHTRNQKEPMSTPRFRRRTPQALAGLIALALVVLFGASACGSSSSAAASGTTLRIGFISNTPTAAGPEGWADHTGILVPGLKAAGITAVKWIPFKNGPDLSAAIQGGSIDIATLGDTPALTAKAQGIPTELVNQSTVGQDAWLFVKKGGPTTITGLKGQTVATQVGSYMYRYLVAELQQQGIDKDVKISHIYTVNAVAALQGGGIAAYAAPAGQLTAAMQKAGFQVIDKASQHNLVGTGVTVITDSALKAHPGLPAAWNAVRAKSIADMKAHQDAYYAFASTATQTPLDVVKSASPISLYPSQPFTSKGLALLQGTDQFLADNKLSKSLVDINAWKVPQS